MTAVLDQAQDLSGTETYRLTSIYPPPPFVKTAAAVALYGDGETERHLFADQMNRRYPCHTAAATWMSTLFFLDKQAGVDSPANKKIEQRLAGSAAYFNIKPLVDQLKQAMAANAGNELAKLADNEFALVWLDDNGRKERHYPLRNGQEVKLAADYLGQYRDKFTYGDRQVMAAKILDKADAIGAGITNRDMLTKMAGYGACANGHIVVMLEKRAKLVKRSHPAYAHQLGEMVKSCEASPLDVRDHSKRVSLARLVDEFDRQTKLARLYDQGLERPEDVLFQITEKMATSFTQDHVATTSGSVYEKDALDQLDLGQVRDWMGDDFAEAVSISGLVVDAAKMASVLPTLPRPDAEMFDKMAQSLGLGLVGRDKAAVASPGISHEELAALAAEYRPAEPVVAVAPSVLD